MMLFENYLKDELEKGTIDFALRAHLDEDGHPSFYIHPLGKDGTTIDYIVLGGCLVSKQVFAPMKGIV